MNTENNFSSQSDQPSPETESNAMSTASAPATSEETTLNASTESEVKDVLPSDTSDAKVSQAVEVLEKTPTPLTTYESMNSGETVVTPTTIQSRLAKIAAEAKNRSGAAGSDTGSSSVPRSGQPVRGEKRSFSKGPSSPRPNAPSNRSESSEEASEDGGPRRDRKGSKGSFKGDRDNKPRRIESPKVVGTVPVPNIRVGLSDDLEDEFNELFQNTPLDDLMGKNVDTIASQEVFEDGTKVSCRVVSIQRDSVFVELGSRDQGIIPLKQFPEEAQPAVGQTVEAVVTRFNEAEGLYEVSLPLAAAEVGDWSSLSEGMIIEARVTGCNKGGLECEVGKLRAFMPLGQIATFRVETPETLIGERWKCIVTEVNPMRRNLLISRRALMEKEREELREKLLAELEVGQVRDGLVRKIIDVGAFVDLGGVDGFIPISAISWGRINHPSEVLKEGERIKVTVTRIDMEKNRISLSFKDETCDPWLNILEHFQERTQTRGRVTNIMQFGAFVELMPGIEGLVHISEISYTRVNNVADVLNVGEFVDVMILSIDQSKRKISLSIKQLRPDPRIEEAEKAKAEVNAAALEQRRQEDEEVEKIRETIRKNQFKGTLKGGINTQSDGSKFGLNW